MDEARRVPLGSAVVLLAYAAVALTRHWWPSAIVAPVLAWLLWLGVHIYFLIGFANRLLVMIQWGLSFLTKRRGVRILSQRRQALDKE